MYLEEVDRLYLGDAFVKAS